MATLGVYRLAAGKPYDRAKHLGKHPKMLITTERGTRFVVPWAPRETSSTGYAPGYEVVERAGRKPLLLFTGLPLLQHDFDIGFGRTDGAPIDLEVQRLHDVVKSRERVRVTFDGRTFDGRLWRITSMSVQVTMRQHGTNRPTQATAAVQLTEASDVIVHVGPITGGSKPAPKPPTPPGRPAKPPRIHVVKRGDTLWAIARKFYGNGALYPRIAKANKFIRNPNLIYPGQRLVIPS